MPRQVNHDERRTEIAEAAVALMGEAGVKGLTMRALAKRLGGTVTMVTHYYPTRQSLLDDIGPALLARWQTDLDSLDAIPDAAAALRGTLMWMLPLDEEGLLEERAWFQMVASAIGEMSPVGAKLRNDMDTWMRDMIRGHLDGLVETHQQELVVDILRAAAHGISIGAVENPGKWPPERQVAVMDELLSALHLD